MAKKNRNKILVPEAKQELDLLKAKVTGSSNPEVTALEVAKELGISLNEGYNGQLTSFEAGKVGGKLVVAWLRSLLKWHKKV